MNQFFNNLFGTIAGSNTVLERVAPNIGYIPIDGQGGTIDIKGQNAAWLGLQNRLMQKWAYEYCYALASVVDKLASADTTGEVEILRYKGKGKEDLATSGYAQRLNKLFAQPNPLQSWEQFRGQQVVYKKISGFCPVLPIMPAGILDPSYCTGLINLPPWTFEVEPTGKYTGQTTIEGLVKRYSCTILNEKMFFEPSQIFMLNDGFMQDDTHFLLPKSKLVGLDMAVSNLCAAMEADNVLLKKRGPLGFISHDAAATKDAIAGYLPMTPGEKIELQNNLLQYGLSLSQFQYVISRQAVKWNPMSYNTKELGTKETIIASEKAICHRYDYSYILYEDSGATYANQSGAHKSLYQNNVIPNANKDIEKYGMFFQAKENNCEITICFDDLPILQENELEKANAAIAWNEALKVQYDNNLITKNQWITGIGMETVADGDSFKSDTTNTDPLAVILGVGGTQALVDFLANPSINREGKINGLQILFGMNPIDANKMVPEQKIQDNGEGEIDPKDQGKEGEEKLPTASAG